MRTAQDSNSFSALFQAAQTEAQAAFGDGEVYLEKFIVRPRHIEFQIFGDQHGRLVHLGERDCSTQRRNQKLIEESPSPVITPELRKRMGKSAILAGEGIGYVGAGTVEFLLSDAFTRYYINLPSTRGAWSKVRHPPVQWISSTALLRFPACQANCIR